METDFFGTCDLTTVFWAGLDFNKNHFEKLKICPKFYFNFWIGELRYKQNFFATIGDVLLQLFLRVYLL